MNNTMNSPAEISPEQFFAEIGSASSHEILRDLFRAKLCQVFGVDMASIFLIDSLKMQLVSWIVLPGESLRKIRIPIAKKSIAGYTAATRGLVLIKDPYDEDELAGIDPELRFDASWDKQKNIQTRQVLSAPILVDRSLLGVVQLMNKADKTGFTEEDQTHIWEFASTLGKTLLAMQRAA